MTTVTVSTAIGIDNVPEKIRRLSTIAHVDYADSYGAATHHADDRSPEEWARAVLEDTSLGRRAREFWQGLGLRLGAPNSPDHVQGWKIAARGHDWIRLETSSSWATAEIVFHVAEGCLSIALFLRFDATKAKDSWSSVSVMHQRAVPALLEQALQRGHNPLG
jgi:hypothetical protein